MFVYACLVITNFVLIEVADQVIREGYADMVSMARPFLADPYFVLKASEGRADEINTCIGCNQACLDHIFEKKTASCLVNPLAAHETTLNILPVLFFTFAKISDSLIPLLVQFRLIRQIKCPSR